MSLQPDLSDEQLKAAPGLDMLPDHVFTAKRLKTMSGSCRCLMLSLPTSSLMFLTLSQALYVDRQGFTVKQLDSVPCCICRLVPAFTDEQLNLAHSVTCPMSGGVHDCRTYPEYAAPEQVLTAKQGAAVPGTDTLPRARFH